MKKMLLKLSPIFFFLFLFSCAKDNDTIPVETAPPTLQARGQDHSCDAPCRRPDEVHVVDIASCSAIFTWGYDEPVACGTFVVILHNLTTNDYTYYDPVESPFLLEDLTPCTQYTVGVSHVTDSCASKPLELSFQTNCKKCKECDVPCEDLDFLTIADLTQDGATVSFGLDNPTCGYFLGRLKNNSTGTYTDYGQVTSPWILTGLEACTSFTVYIAHVTDQCAYIPTSLSFTTNCEEYCPASGENASCLYDFDILTFDDYLLINNPAAGYVDATNQSVTLSPGTLDGIGNTICHCNNLQKEIYIKLWIDYNQNFEFESTELELFHPYFAGGDGSPTVTCSGVILPLFNVPNIEACGLRARYIISDDPDAGPCGDFSTGQVIDFTVNTLEDC